MSTYGFVADKVLWQILILLPVVTTFELRPAAVVVVVVAAAVAGAVVVGVGFDETVNEIDEAVAEACVPLAAIGGDQPRGFTYRRSLRGTWLRAFRSEAFTTYCLRM